MFVSNGKFEFVEVEEKISSKGNPFSIVKVIDLENHYHLEFFADKELKVTVNRNQACKIVLKAVKQGYSTSMNCVSVTPV